MMSRFRFWYEREDFYPDENYMRDVYKIEYVSDSEIYLNDHYIFNPYTNVAESIYSKAKIHLMQSTGLRDKNGVEIYEGDIVKRIRRFSGSFGEKHTGEVVYDREHARYIISKPQRNTEPKTEDLRNALSDKSTYEVIGNTYDNPEWLEEEEPLHYALIKDHELITDSFKYWNLSTIDNDVFVGSRDAVGYTYLTEMSKEDWERHGINDSNADFIKEKDL